MQIREVKEEDFLDVAKFVKSCYPLEPYPKHFYKILFRYFRNTCFIAESQGKVIGFAFGVFSQTKPQTCFFWQIGIDSKLQGKGIGRKVVGFFEQKVRELGCSRIELTIDLDNLPSQKLFEKLDYKNISSKEGSIFKGNDKVAVKDYYGPGRHFLLYEKAL